MRGWWRSVNWSVSSHIAAGGRALRQPVLSVKPRGAGVPRVVAGLGSWPVCRSQSQERAGQTCSARLRCCCLNPNITERLFGNYQSPVMGPHRKHVDTASTVPVPNPGWERGRGRACLGAADPALWCGGKDPVPRSASWQPPRKVQYSHFYKRRDWI